MTNHLAHLAALLLTPLFFLYSGKNSEPLAESFSTFSQGGSCIEIIDPNTGAVSSAFVVDTVCQGHVQDFCLSTDGCNNDIEIISVTGNLGQVIITPPTSPFNDCFSYTAPANLVGEDSFALTVTNTETNGVISTTTVDITYVVADPQHNTTVSAPLEICSPANSATIEAINPDPIVGGYWIILQGGGTITDETNPVANITNLPFGESIFMWRQNYPCQSTFDLTKVTVYDGQAPIANAGEHVVLCSFEDAYTMQANDPLFSATGTWEITFGNATINDINDPHAEVSNIGIGCNIFEWNISNGPCPGGETVSQMTICVYDQNAPSSYAGEDIEICFSAAGSNTIITDALDLEPYNPAEGLWTPISGFGVIEDSDDNATLIENLQIGINEFVWTVSNGDCPGFPSQDTLEIRVYDPNHPAPNAGNDAEYCAPVDTHQLSAEGAISPAVGTWSVENGSGSFSNASDPNAVVSNLSVGINTYRWTIYNGPCNTEPFFSEVDITVFDPNVAATSAGNDLVFCETEFAGTNLQASPIIYPATGEWTITSPASVFASDVLSDINDPNALLSGVSPGAYTLRWSVNNGPCAGGNNFDEINLNIFPDNQTIADAGSDLDLCTPITSFNLSGNAAINPGEGNWTLISGGGAIQNSNDPNSSVSNLAIGQNVFRWTITNGGCEPLTNFDEVIINVFNVDAEPAFAGADQEFCSSPASSITVQLAANTPQFPAVGEWTIVSGTGNFSNINDPNATVVSPGFGVNIYQWAINNGACDVSSNTDLINIEIYNSQEPDAEAGIDISVCSDVISATLSANTPSAPAQGTWSVVQGTGIFGDANDPNSDVTGYGLGTNTYRWTIVNGPCTPPFTFDDVSLIVYNIDVEIANAGEDLDICNNFGPVTLSATSFQAPATGQWNVISGAGDFSNITDPNSTVTGWDIGENIYEWSVDNGPCSGGSNNDQIIITVYDINADQADAGSDQELCTPITATSLNAVTPSSPSTGYWTVISGTGLFLDNTDPQTQVTGLSVGNNTFTWTIDNGACSPIFSQDEVTISLFQEGAAESDAGFDQNFCEPVSSTTLSANTPSEPSSGVWTLVSGTGIINDPTDPNTSVSEITQGINIFQWTVYSGPCEQENQEDQVAINIFEDNHPEANAGEDIEICTPLNSLQLNGSDPVSPATGSWIQVSGPNSAVFDPDENQAIITNLIPGIYVFQWQIDIGPCSSEPITDQMEVRVFDSNADAADAGTDIYQCTPNNIVTLQGNNTVGAAQGQWTQIAGSGSFSNTSDPNATVSNLTVGENIFVWTIDNGSCGLGLTTDTVSVFLFDSASPDALAGEDQSLCTPQSTSTLSGNTPVFPATVEWALVSGSGSVVNPNDPSTGVTNLQIGENIFSYTIYNGNCLNAVTTDEISIFVFDSGAPAADAGEDQEICSNNSTTQLNATAAADPGIGIWSLISGDAGVIVSDSNNPQATISNLQIGIYVFRWSLDYSTCGTQGDDVTITVFDIEQEDTDAGDNITLCLPDNTATLNGNPNQSPAQGSWIVLSGSATFSNINDPNAVVTNLAVGENILGWSVYNGVCTPPEDLTDEMSVFVYEENLPDAFAGVDQEFCSENGASIDVQMTAFTPTNPGTGVWTVVQGSGNFTNASEANTLVTNIGQGINIFEWNVEYGSCAAPSSDQITISVYNEQEPAADAGPDQSFCSPVSTVSLSANNPNLPATGGWSQIVGTAVFSDVTNPNTTITNIGVGVTILRWSIDNGPCESSNSNDLITIFVYDENASDSMTGEDQELCLPETSTNLSGNLPVFPGVGTWSQIEGTSTINNNNNPNSPVSNLSPGINRFVWEVFNGPCANSITRDTLTISVFDPTSPVADAGQNQELCSFTTTAVLSASIPISPGTGTWVQVLGSPAVITNPTSPNTSVTGLDIGINSFQWSIYNGPCENSISSDVMIINVYDENQDPSEAGSTQDLCLPINSTNLTANQVVSPALGQWSLVSGSGLIADISNPTSAVSQLGVGANLFSWTIDNGPCNEPISNSTITINVFDPGSEPAFTVPDIQECAPVSSVTISANEALGASIGTWTQVQGDAVIDDSSNEITDLTNLDVGTYIFQWEINNGSCGGSQDTLIVEIFDPSGLNANAGANQSYCTPINSTTLEGSAIISPATGVWNVVIGNGDLVDPTNPESEITNLIVGETILSWTVDNGPCGGITSDFVSIFIFDESAPNAFAGDDQEFCLPITQTNLAATNAVFPAIGSWTLISGNATIQNINSPNTLITDLAVGENVFVWTVDNSPCENGETTDTVSVFVYPNEYDLAFAGDDQSFCSPQNSTFTTANVPADPSEGTWDLTNGSGSIVDVNAPNTELIQLGIGTNNFSWQVYHGPCDPEVSLDIMTIQVYDENHPPADAGEDQEFCLPDNSSTLNGNTLNDPVTGEWTLISGSAVIIDATDPLTSVTDLGVGENVFVWSTDNGPCENPLTTDTVTVRIYSEDAAPANAGDNINVCGESSVTLGAQIPDTPSTGTWTVVSGPSSYSFNDVTDPNAEFSALVIGEYALQWIVDNSPCADPISSDQMIVNVFDVNQNSAFAGDTLRQCFPDDVFTLSAIPVTAPSIGTWTVNGAGSISDINDPFATLTDVNIGEYTMTWTVDNGPCGTTSDDLVIELYDPNNPSADAGPDIQVCTDLSLGSEATMAANSATSPAFGTWTTVFGTPPDISDIHDPNAVLSDFGYGETQLVWTINNGPCDGDAGPSSDTISVFHFDSNESDAYAGNDQDFCGNPQTVTLDANPTIGNTAVGVWTVTSSPAGSPDLVFVDEFEESTSVSGCVLGVYELTWTVDNGFCGITSDMVTINAFDPSTPDAYAGENERICEDEFLDDPSLFLQGNVIDLPSTVSWSILTGNAILDQSALNTPNPEVTYLGELPEPLSTVNNSFIYTVDNGPCGTSSDTVSYTLIDCLTIQVPDAFSPNGDLINDEWYIPNLEKYPNNEIMIFNRWGTKVFESKAYAGDWTGISEHPATIGDELPVGTYYYVLDLGNGTAAYKGFVYLKR